MATLKVSRSMKVNNADRLRASEWEVRDTGVDRARAMIEAEHYAKGASNTFSYLHGLFRRGENDLCGVAWWLPPIKGAAQKVSDDWRRVLALSRLVIAPMVPKNAATFLMARSIRIIESEGRFSTLVTYADIGQGHTGTIYRAANWTYDGISGARTRWIDPKTGRHVSDKATLPRTKKEMLDMGYVEDGKHSKHRFFMRLNPRKVREPAQGVLLA